MNSMTPAVAEGGSLSPPGPASDTPISQPRPTIDREMIEIYLTILFRHVEPAAGVIQLRGIGEGGTPKEGKPFGNVTLRLDGDDTFSKILETVERWGANQVAAYILPAILDTATLTDQRGAEDRIRLFSGVLIDIDDGDTAAKLAHLNRHLVAPTLVVRSGGTTKTGQPKMHIYWALTEPTAEIAKVAAIRAHLARLVGGDPSFARPAQVIRVPGTIYAKGGVAKMCSIGSCDLSREYDLDEIAEAVEAMPCLPGINVPQQARPLFGEPLVAMGGGLDFSGVAGIEIKQPVGRELIEKVHAGGVDGVTRWGRFNEVAGHYWHCVRKGEMTLAEADAAIRGWIPLPNRPALVPLALRNHGD